MDTGPLSGPPRRGPESVWWFLVPLMIKTTKRAVVWWFLATPPPEKCQMGQKYPTIGTKVSGCWDRGAA